ncbi:MAG: dissimilatory-type sulfite reductase subunit alpha [Archaeoglobales archaeon]|nr:MAG: dissimilatory-type sulfite reductase subunit alpha [Archaeoglobales archaeon]
MSETPLLDQIPDGPWPSFVKEIRKTAEIQDKLVAEGKEIKMPGSARGLLKQLERSYKDKRTHWKHGGIVAVVGYGGGVIGRYSDLEDEIPEVHHFHTIRVNMPAGWFYTTKALRQLCDAWEKWGSGITNFHGSTGDIILLGTRSEYLQPMFEEMMRMDPPFDIGGSGSDLRTPSACMGPAMCEFACYDTLDLCYELTMEFQNELHRPMWPYKFKFKCSGCPNDCVAAKARSDFAIIGTWKDEIQIDQEAVREYAKWMDIENEVVKLCPTGAIKWDGKELTIDNKNCVRCMHCINKMPKALKPGKERGATILIGGKAPFVEGAILGWVAVPFIEIKKPYTEIKEMAERLWEWWDDVGKFRERVGELIWRRGMREFLRVIGKDVDVRMIRYPRTNPFMFFEKHELRPSKYLEELDKKGVKIRSFTYGEEEE